MTVIKSILEIKSLVTLLCNISLLWSLCYGTWLQADELFVGRSCPVKFHNIHLGLLVISQPWFHSSRSNAAYIASDNATGIGVEIHFFANQLGDTRFDNVAKCERYRMMQIRNTTAKLFSGEQALQLDLPVNPKVPFYDEQPREFGRGTHYTPLDTRDKPWHGQPVRSSTVAIYDTPYVSDSYGSEGKDIRVQFETCVVCQRKQTPYTLLSCLSWGYEREYMGGQTGWSEPELLTAQCNIKGSSDIDTVVNNTPKLRVMFGW